MTYFTEQHNLPHIALSSAVPHVEISSYPMDEHIQNNLQQSINDLDG